MRAPRESLLEPWALGVVMDSIRSVCTVGIARSVVNFVPVKRSGLRCLAAALVILAAGSARASLIFVGDADHASVHRYEITEGGTLTQTASIVGDPEIRIAAGMAFISAYTSNDLFVADEWNGNSIIIGRVPNALTAASPTFNTSAQIDTGEAGSGVHTPLGIAAARVTSTGALGVNTGLYAVSENNESNNLVRLAPNASGASVSYSYSLGFAARGVAVSPWGELFVSDFASDKVHRYIDTGSGFTANGTIAVGDSPHGLAFRDDELFVVNYAANSISRFTFSSDTTSGSAAAGSTITGNGLDLPVFIAVSPWGELFVSNDKTSGNKNRLARFTFADDSAGAASSANDGFNAGYDTFGVTFSGHFSRTVGWDGDVLNDPTLTSSSNYLYVGVSGDGTLAITNGGQVSNSYTYVGYNSSSTGMVSVDGTGSTWTNHDEIIVGYFGDGTLGITNGGHVSNSYSQVGYIGGSIGIVSVDGEGSTWTNSNDLTIGNTSDGTLNIQNGGSVSNSYGYIGYGGGSTGVVTVDAAMWTNSANLFVGDSGAGTLNIQNGGQVNVAGDTWVGYAGGAGLIDFDNGTLTTRGLLAPAANLTGVGTINAHGLVTDTDLVFDATHGLTQTVVLNSEPGQTISINLQVDGTAAMGAGYAAAGSLSIADGLALNSTDGYLGYKAGSTGMVTVDAATWTNSGSVFVGYSGDGTLNIQNGGSVTNSYGYVGYRAGSTAEVTVDAATWTNNVGLSVGYSGAGTLNIQNGGSVSNTIGYIGVDNSSTGVVTVDAATWTNSSNLYVGVVGDGTLNIHNGASVSDQAGWVGIGDGSTGVVTVDAATWSNSGYLSIGNSGNGTLNIQNGGHVDVGGPLQIGYDPGSSGTLNLLGGMLDMQGNNIFKGSGTATFNFTGGTLKNVGTFDFDLVQNGGTLAAGNSPGIMNITGDYTLNAGTIEVELAGIGGVAGVDFDFYDITGVATLSGMMNLSFLNASVPPDLTTFDVLRATTIDASALTLTGRMGFTYSIIDDSGDQVLRLTYIAPVPTPAALPAGLALLAGIALRRRVL
ncbi:MAG: hypothetical protein GC162_18445 [Planctomycetes bacterium]|nr:hypothetical protein [Planctomycetota bacterium]